jgi:hypothetical protein
MAGDNQRSAQKFRQSFSGATKAPVSPAATGVVLQNPLKIDVIPQFVLFALHYLRIDHHLDHLQQL